MSWLKEYLEEAKIGLSDVAFTALLAFVIVMGGTLVAFVVLIPIGLVLGDGPAIHIVSVVVAVTVGMLATALVLEGPW